MAQIAIPVARDTKIIGLVSFGHMLSHFYFLVIPPILILLKADIEASYLGFGVVLGAFSFSAFLFQTPVGFLVDRIGAVRLLVWGLLIETVCIGLMGFSQTFWHLLVLYALAGLANSVFHPADYAILAASVDRSRLGRAFSVHLFSGNLGFAITPFIMLGLAELWGWRGAFHAVGLFGFGFALYLWSQQHVLERAMAFTTDAEDNARNADLFDGMKLLFSFPIMMCLLFFVLLTLGFTGIKLYFVTAVGLLFETPLTTANIALTGFLMGTALGIIAGGFIADRFGIRRVTAFVTLGTAALLIALVGTVTMSQAGVFAAITAAGFLQGLLLPTRDLLIRQVTPDGSMGKVMGFLSSGLMGASFAVPILFGWMLDHGMLRPIFWFSAAFIAAAMFAFVTTQSDSKQEP
jgi:FSR family fosmidomycin resistance protein-like MFS transporter